MLNKNIIIDNLRINYYQSPRLKTDGTLVFLPGWQANTLIFRGLWNVIDNYIAIDWPGFGESEQPKEIWGLQEYANCLKKFLEKLGIANPVLVGHSFGGSVVIKYVGGGLSVKKIILIDSAGIRRKSFKNFVYLVAAKIVKIFLWLPVIRKYRQVVRKKFYKTIDAVDYPEAGEMKKIYQKVITEDLTGELPKVRVKTALIWGEKDRATPIEDGILMNKLIDNSELLVIKDAGHFPFLEREEEFKKIFLKQL